MFFGIRVDAFYQRFVKISYKENILKSFVRTMGSNFDLF